MNNYNKNESRRKFLKNTAISGLSLGIVPLIAATGIDETEETNLKTACNPTTQDYYGQGPFYTANPPVIVNHQLAASTEAGTRLIISGIVQTKDCTKVIPNATIDIWQANDAGAYDNQGYNLRGITTTNAQGFYMFETILPGKYLNGASYRPRHIHFKITAPGFPTQITQLYFEGDTDITGDAAASITSGTYDATHRIIPIALNTQGKYEGIWDIAVDGNGVSGVTDLHLENGMLYTVSPNPFTDELHIRYGVFKKAKVSIQVFDMKGSQVAILDEENLEAGKYTAEWSTEGFIPAGIYWIALKINDLQVHYLKIAKI